MVKQLRNGRDLTGWLVNLVARISGNRKVKMKIVSSKVRGASEFKNTTQESIDRILDKINKSGFDSLTKDEKDLLYKASGKK